MAAPTLLLLADGRFPAGGHAHSGGLEAAVAAGLVDDPPSLARWLEGRLRTVGFVEAAFAGAAQGLSLGWPGALPGLDAELAARVVSAAGRRASRSQGRGLLRTARASWPASHLDDLWTAIPDGPLHPVAIGAVAAAAGLSAVDTALAAAMNSVQGPAWAATRLMGTDPSEVAAALAALVSAVDDVARAAVDAAVFAGGDPSALPALSAPLLDLGAEEHSTWEVRLFAS